MSQKIAGMVSMRMAEVERHGHAVVPGTGVESCGRCGEKVAVSPEMYRVLNREGPRIWCWECLWDIHPEGVNYIATREMIQEMLLVHRLERQMKAGGPVH